MIRDNIGSSCVARWITECVWSVIRSGFACDLDVFCYKDFEAVDLCCSLGKGALDRVSASHMVLPFLYTMVKVYRWKMQHHLLETFWCMRDEMLEYCFEWFVVRFYDNVVVTV